MTIRIITLAALGSLALAACSGGDDAAKTDAATDVASDTAVKAPPGSAAPTGDVTPAPVEPAMPPRPEGDYPPGQTPPTLPTEPAMTSPATSPPPQ